MIGKYYNGIVEQVYRRLGEVEQNIVMAQYSNDFSIADLAEIQNCSEKKRVFTVYYEFSYNEISGGYDPFLSIIFQMFRTYGNGDFQKFLEECGVYVPHREILESYYRTGHCSRTEMVLLDEVEYEHRRITEGIAAMLRKVAELCPVFIVVNRFQMAGRSTMELVCELLRKSSSNIGLVLGANEKPVQHESILNCWDKLIEALEDGSHIYHIGNSEMRRGAGRSKEKNQNWDIDKVFDQLSNMVALLDYDQAQWYFQNIIYKIQFEDEEIPDEKKMLLYPLYIQVSILQGNFARALEMNKIFRKLKIRGKEQEIAFGSEYYLALCQMYQGKLEESDGHCQRAWSVAEAAGNEKMKLEAELLRLQIRMAGWHNLLYCIDDIEIPEEFLQKLMKYGYRNHLAHIYIYAYDNKPEKIGQAYREYAAFSRFHRGIALAQEIGNELLVYSAYEKNIMIAAANGYYEAALFYLMKNYQFEKDRCSQEGGRTYSAIGYNLSALGQYHLAEYFYQKALKLFLEIGLPEDIAEVHYNMSLNCILNREFSQAEHYLQLCIKTIGKLGLNSLRVCNMAKLYGMMAVVCMIQDDKFSCQRYLLNSEQILNFMIGKEGHRIETNHDYAKVDDELFLFWFAKALIKQAEGKNEQAYRYYGNAEEHYLGTKGNLFYIYRIFCEKQIELFASMERMDLYNEAELKLKEYLEYQQKTFDSLPKWLLEKVQRQVQKENIVSESQIESLVKQESLARRIRKSQNQMEFLSRWQKLIDVNDVSIETMTAGAMNAFLTQFGNDGALYIRYHHRVPRVIYNDTKTVLTEEAFEVIDRTMHAHPQGFAVSKINGNFSEHQELLSYFNKNDIGSLAAVPFFKNGCLDSVVLTYILMKENWRSSGESYCISEEDLPVYQLLFREMGYSINRVEAYEKIYEMNQKLARAATTDMLTGIYNRTGLYKELEFIINRIRTAGTYCSLAVMFIDLDNFKIYNDTYGHNVGDIILKSMAGIFREILNGKGIVSRYGGDEFLLVLEETDKDFLEKTALEIYRKLDEADGFNHEISELLGQKIVIDPRHRITCSIGIAVNEKVSTEEEIEELIKNADKILYSIKGHKKGTYAFENRLF